MAAAMDIGPAEELASVAMEPIPDTTFAEKIYVPFLRQAQNSDGGWGFRPGAASRAEPTCWALKALVSRDTAEHEDTEDILRGLNFLTGSQLPDGSWSSTPEEKNGCWVTSLACWVLASSGDEKYSKAIASGLHWVCEDLPRDSGPWRRWMRKLFSSGRHSKQNDALRGWGWTPGTSSWVEPTAFALLALESRTAAELPGNAEERRILGEALLYDRMCPGGGWNCGNPEVYGVAGEPLVIPTTWALLALRRHPERRENIESLAWMEKNFAKIQGPGSYALARVCLSAYGRRRNEDGAGASDCHAKEYHARNESLQSVQVAAWMCLAAGDTSNWLASAGVKSR
jgi:Prenyltransferase and squalene oxidase repeat